MAKNYGCRFLLGNCLFGAVKLTKNADPENINILAMILDLTYVKAFYYQMVVGLIKLL